ncbi:hypothetical protein V8E52_010367 [Russula decolorans]
MGPMDCEPAFFPNHVPSMSMDDWMKLVDAWIAEGQARSYDDALGIDSGTTSSWPQRNNQDLGSENRFLDDGLKSIDAWMAGRQVRSFDDTLGIDSGTTSSWPQRNNQDLGPENRFLEDGLKSIDAWMAGRQVRSFDDTLGIDSGTTCSWPQRNNQDLGSENGFLADWQAQTPLVTGVWSNGAFNNTPDHEMIPRWTTSQEIQGRRVIAAEPGSQAPGVTVNGVALRLPQAKLPSYNQSATASGFYAQEDLTQKVSKAAPKSWGPRRNPSVPQRGFRCPECTRSEGKAVTFKTERSLRRHLDKTKRHNAPSVLRCSCGTEVVREDAMYSHRKSCKGTIMRLEG